MKERISVTLILAIAIAVLAGCKTTPERTAYQVVATTVATVDSAMSAWGDYVRLGLATQSDENTVRAAYANYQRAMGVTKAAVIAVKTGTATGQSDLDTALDAVEAAAGQLVHIIETIRNAP